MIHAYAAKFNVTNNLDFFFDFCLELNKAATSPSVSSLPPFPAACSLLASASPPATNPAGDGEPMAPIIV